MHRAVGQQSYRLLAIKLLHHLLFHFFYCLRDSSDLAISSYEEKKEWRHQYLLHLRHYKCWLTHIFLIEDNTTKDLSEENLESQEKTPLLSNGDTQKLSTRKPMSELPFKEQILSLDNFLFSLYLTVSILWLNMYIGTVPNQIEPLTPDRATGMPTFFSNYMRTLTTPYSWFLCWGIQLGASRCFPHWSSRRLECLPNGYEIQCTALFRGFAIYSIFMSASGMAWSLIVVHAMAVLFALLKFVPNLQIQLITFVVASVYRAFFYTALIAIVINMYAPSKFFFAQHC